MDLFKKTILVFFLFYSLNGFSQAVTYECSYGFDNNTRYIETTESLGSVNIHREINNLKYTFVISDVKNMNEIDDYVVIENDKGHKITYSMLCK